MFCMYEEKNFDEQVKEYIKQVCESGKFDVSCDEFDVEVTFNATHHNIKCSCIYLENEWDLTYKTTLTEKDGKFHHSIYGSTHPKYIATYAVIGYSETKKKYYEKCENKKVEEENKKSSWFNKFFRRRNAGFSEN